MSAEGKAAIARAKREIAEEAMKEGVAKLKVKLRELSAAETIVRNVQREITDLEQAIEDGNAI